MKIFIHRGFRKQYQKIPKRQKDQFKKRRDLFLQNPFHPILNNHALHGKYEGYRSINITGDLRVIYQPIGKDVALFIIIDIHSNLYS